MQFLIVNGNIIAKEEANLSGFLWNDPILVSQKVWFGFGGIPLLKENVANLKEQLNSLGADLPPLFTNFRELFRLCKRLLNKNKYYRSGHLLFQFSISAQEVNFLVTAENYTGFNFPLNEQGLLVNISSARKGSKQSFNNLSSQNQLFWNAAKTTLAETPFQNSIICDEQGFVIESIAANVYFIKNGVLITPSLESGCYNDVMRKIVLEQAAEMQLKILEPTEIKTELLFDMDEAFLVSEARGFEWILGIENKRFVRSFSRAIFDNINEFLELKVNQSR
ncbi:aminotransferase class IV [Maribellus sediminis]|uniref:aminotransferase class IV n=1 Tax=Maribellus sediminis TaxID=2696285 RepID=UPI00142FAFB2|nr:aminotransferase class IV [Maribellus sediminis]